VDENCALLGCYAACNGNCLPTFRHKICPIFKAKMWPIGSPETSAGNCHCTLFKDPLLRFLTVEHGTDSLSRNEYECGQKSAGNSVAFILLVRITVLAHWRIPEICQSRARELRPRRDLPLAAQSIAHRAVISADPRNAVITVDATRCCKALKR